MTDDRTKWTNSVVRVGSGGRGFVAETGGQTLIVTAAHCLPNLPPGMGGGALTEELTYANILGQLGEEPTAWAECLFVDPVADLAVLGSPDGQELFEEAAAYEALVESKAMAIGRVPLVRPPVILLGETILGRPEWKGRGWLLSLDNRWFGCNVSATFRYLCLENAAEPIRAGMSGSPIVSLGPSGWRGAYHDGRGASR